MQFILLPLAWLALPSILIMFPAIFIANLYALIAPLILLMYRHGSWIISPILLLGAICGLSLPEELTGNVYRGYYVWIASLLLIAIAQTLNAFALSLTEE